MHQREVVRVEPRRAEVAGLIVDNFVVVRGGVLLFVGAVLRARLPRRNHLHLVLRRARQNVTPAKLPTVRKTSLRKKLCR